MPATTGRLIPDCPNCRSFADDKRSRPTAFTMNGVTHAAPDMWLAGRSERIKREASCDSFDAFRLALHDWTTGCSLAIAFEAQRERR